MLKLLKQQAFIIKIKYQKNQQLLKIITKSKIENRILKEFPNFKILKVIILKMNFMMQINKIILKYKFKNQTS